MRIPPGSYSTGNAITVRPWHSPHLRQAAPPSLYGEHPKPTPTLLMSSTYAFYVSVSTTEYAGPKHSRFLPSLVARRPGLECFGPVLWSPIAWRLRRP